MSTIDTACDVAAIHAYIGVVASPCSLVVGMDRLERTAIDVTHTGVAGKVDTAFF